MLGANFLIGAEVDASLANIEGDTPSAIIIGGGNGNYNWTATAKLRAGIANHWGMIYAVGGLGLAGFEYQEPNGFGFDQVRSGWLVGGGAEVKISNRTSLKAEYNYIDFGSESDVGTSYGFIPGYVDTDAQLHLVKLGLNYQLGVDDGSGGGGTDYATIDYGDWSGFYVGLHAGYAWGNRNGCIDYIDIFSDCDLSTDIIGAVPFDYNQEGWLAGAQLGYNHQMGMFVLGAEVDASLADIEGRTTGFLFGTGKGEYDWTASAKRRAGLAFNNAMIYATGGLGVAGFEWQEASGCTFDQTRTGWLVGGGAEMKVSRRASIKAEYNYVDYGSKSDRCTSFSILPGYVDTDATAHVVKFGVNYQLGK